MGWNSLRFLAGSWVLLLAMMPLSLGGAPAVPNPDGAFLQVYVNNVENLVTPENPACPGDYRALLAYIRTQDYLPDLLLVQQISGADQAASYAKELGTSLGADYAYVIAQDRPKPQSEHICEAKRHQTNAIFYRTGRLALVPGSTFVWRSSNDSATCQESQNDRALNVGAQFRDLLHPPGRLLTVGSVHWPTSSNTLCNIDSTVRAMGGIPSSQLILFGGDMNDDDLDPRAATWKPWYRKVNGALSQPGNHGFTDAIYSLCAEGAPGLEAIQWRSRQNGTLNKSFRKDAGEGRRIDFLFARHRSAAVVKTSHQHTITPAEVRRAAGAVHRIDYSDHRAIRARVYHAEPAPQR